MWPPLVSIRTPVTSRARARARHQRRPRHPPRPLGRAASWPPARPNTRLDRQPPMLCPPATATVTATLTATVGVGRPWSPPLMSTSALQLHRRQRRQHWRRRRNRQQQPRGYRPRHPARPGSRSCRSRFRFRSRTSPSPRRRCRTGPGRRCRTSPSRSWHRRRVCRRTPLRCRGATYIP